MNTRFDPGEGDGPRPFPTLPILGDTPPRLSTREKYGGVYWLGLTGLLVLLALIGGFAHGLWSMRGVWADIYTLHDRNRPDDARIRSAYRLSRDPRVNSRQRWEMCLRRPLPALARYLLAESLGAEAASADPRGYALAVARSPDWPDWLRLLLCRPMAYAEAEGKSFPVEPLRELSRNADRALALWAVDLLASNPTGPDLEARNALEQASRRGGPEQELARLLLLAAQSRGRPERQRAALDKATSWLRRHHPPSASVWDGWDERDGGLARTSAPKLQ